VVVNYFQKQPIIKKKSLNLSIMKKLLLILLTLFLFSCEKEDAECDCNGKYKLFTYPEQNYYKKTIIDCNTKQPLYNQNQSNSIFVGCE
jgi:hypothetical protein